MLEGEADPAEHLDAVLGRLDRAVERDHRGDVGGERPLVVVAVAREATDATSHAAAVTASAVSSISAHRCLIAWKAADLLAELLAHLGVLDRGRQAPAGDARRPRRRASVTAVRRTSSSVRSGTATPAAASSTRPCRTAGSGPARSRSDSSTASRGQQPPAVGRRPARGSRTARPRRRRRARSPTTASSGSSPSTAAATAGPEQRAGHQLVGAGLERHGHVERRTATAAGRLGQPDRRHAHLAQRRQASANVAVGVRPRRRGRARGP